MRIVYNERISRQRSEKDTFRKAVRRSIVVPPNLYDYGDKVAGIKKGILKYNKKKMNMTQHVQKLKTVNKKLKTRIRIYNTESPVKNSKYEGYQFRWSTMRSS